MAATAGCPPTAEAVHVMHEQSLDLSRHEAQPLTDQLTRHADYLLTMTQGHQQAIVQRWPNSAERTHLLLADGADVADPIGQTLAAYRECADQIAAGVNFHAQRICEELGVSCQT
jgi:protein-tyrosine phosphatase